MSRAVLALPGRGAYTPAALGSIGDDPLVGTADGLRAEHGLPPLGDVDAADAFEASVHLRPANAAPLIYLAALRHARSMAAEHEVVAIVGNGLGWCTALAVAGVLSPQDGLRLVQEVGIAQEAAGADGGAGGQLLYPLTDADWRPVAERSEAVAAALDSTTDAWLAIELGAFAVLGGTSRGLQAVAASLPPAEIAGRSYPIRLGLHGPDHTPLAEHVARAVGHLADLEWRSPATTLVDGRGARHTPWTADPAELARYTLGEHLVSTYRFATSLRVALREYAPDRILLPGPGATLAGIVGAVIVGEGYHGIRDRAAFAAAQAADPPLVVAADG